MGRPGPDPRAPFSVSAAGRKRHRVHSFSSPSMYGGRMRFRPSLLLVLAVSPLMVACGQGAAPKLPAETDPAITAALGRPILIDPDLVSMNDANAVAQVPDFDRSVPTIDTGPDAIARARAAALDLLGGQSNLKSAPAAREAGEAQGRPSLLTSAARVVAASGEARRCTGGISHGMVWAARMPPSFPVYPMGAVQEAAGIDQAGCALRVVAFHTPVPVADVMDFYFTRATAAGFTVDRVMQQGDDVLAATRGKGGVIVYARQLPSGATEVDLVTSGV